MSVNIALDQVSAVYTNLDIVTGRAILKLPRDEDISAIVIKLECESRTRLAAPSDDRRGTYDTELEVHKVGTAQDASRLVFLMRSIATV